jgi:peptidoglycan/xylan/chitin deacetylase (PgdA/CDA1 family)
VTVDLDTLLDCRAGIARLRGRPVVITFDDGYRDCINYAVPVLRQYGFTAVFYLVAGLMGQPSRWLRPIKGFELDLIDWGTARELAEAGYQIGSHTSSHPHLADLSPEACEAELCQSRQILQQHLHRPVRHLAFPFGSFDESVRALAARAGYRSACTTEIGLSTRLDDPLALHRVPVTGYDSLADFAWRLVTAYPLGEWWGSKFHALFSFRWLTPRVQGQ